MDRTRRLSIPSPTCNHFRYEIFKILSAELDKMHAFLLGGCDFDITTIQEHFLIFQIVQNIRMKQVINRFLFRSLQVGVFCIQFCLARKVAHGFESSLYREGPTTPHHHQNLITSLNAV